MAATVCNWDIQSRKIGKGKEVKEKERAFIVGMARGVAIILKLARETKRPRGTIATIVKKFRLSGNCQTAKRSGRPSKTTPRDQRHLEKLVNEDQRAPARDLAKKWGEMIQKSLNKRTTRRRLNSLIYIGRQARKKPYIRPKTKQKRTEWAREMKDKTKAYWTKVVCKDESKIKISRSDGLVFVRRKSTEELLPFCILGTVNWGWRDINNGMGLHVLWWSCSTHHCWGKCYW